MEKRFNSFSSRLPQKDIPKFVWLLNENDVDFSDLSEGQICNHFEGIHQITTKQGFCELSKEFHEINENSLEIAPRSYNLGDPIHREEFIDDFRISAAMNILKYYLFSRLCTIFKLSSCGTVLSEVLLKNALFAALWELRIKVYGEYPCVDISKYFRDKDVSLTEEEWFALLQKSYEMVELNFFENLMNEFQNALLETNNGPIKPSSTCIISFILSNHSFFFHHLKPLDYRIVHILLQYKKYFKQYDLNGYRNIWIVKSPDSSCGIGMKLSYKLETILLIEKNMGSRIVQKYIENPLLTPPIIAPSSTNSLLSPIGSSSSKQSKFDIRIWVLVTSFHPTVQAYIYSTCYGRRCSTTYSRDVQTLSDHFVHLTNYTLQKKNKKFFPNNSSNHQQNNIRGVPTVNNLLTADRVDNDERNHNDDEDKEEEDEEEEDDDDNQTVSTTVTTSSAKKLRNLCKEARVEPETVVKPVTTSSKEPELLIRKCFWNQRMFFPFIFFPRSFRADDNSSKRLSTEALEVAMQFFLFFFVFPCLE
jgi:hypothetical protein